ncbi:MAG: cytochrome b [Pseudomonadota bacterium]
MNDHRLPYHLDSWIALGMLLAALLIAWGLSQKSSAARSLATATAATLCALTTGWFLLIASTGIFENPRPPLFPTDAIKPTVLLVQAAVTFVAAVFLCWAAVKQRQRLSADQGELRNSQSSYGTISRSLHWTTAVLFLLLIPMGVFTSMIPEDVEWRQGYYVVHKTLGFVVLFLLILRLFWHFASPKPKLDEQLTNWERRSAKSVHFLLYVFMIAFPITGFVMSTFGGKLSHIFIWDLPLFWETDLEAIKPWGLLHKLVLPYLFYLIIIAHVFGVLKHHFWDGHRESIRRMIS